MKLPSVPSDLNHVPDGSTTRGDTPGLGYSHSSESGSAPPPAPAPTCPPPWFCLQWKRKTLLLRAFTGSGLIPAGRGLREASRSTREPAHGPAAFTYSPPDTSSVVLPSVFWHSRESMRATKGDEVILAPTTVPSLYSTPLAMALRFSPSSRLQGSKYPSFFSPYEPPVSPSMLSQGNLAASPAGFARSIQSTPQSRCVWLFL
mmetsp:Transcript_19692/g.44443  ORF Transcript_19692/g.44443 Transcript_19692/m.44443 type:complete len:203 (+) Transcript_19692:597-1205(+)